jgi:hypothetical protein
MPSQNHSLRVDNILECPQLSFASGFLTMAMIAEAGPHNAIGP